MRELSRPRCSVFIAQSLDGYIARPDGRTDWLASVERPGQDYGFATFFETIDTLVLGSSTYETALTFPEWPYGDKRCVVLTTRQWRQHHHEEYYSGDVRQLAERLKAEGSRHVYVDGGMTIRSFLRAGLVDEITLSVIPRLLGRGIRLFEDNDQEIPLQLLGTQSFPSGLAQLIYRPLT